MNARFHPPLTADEHISMTRLANLTRHVQTAQDAVSMAEREMMKFAEIRPYATLAEGHLDEVRVRAECLAQYIADVLANVRRAREAA